MPRATVTTKAKIFDTTTDAGGGRVMGYRIHAVSGDVLVGVLPGDNDPENQTLTHRVAEGQTIVLRVSVNKGQGHTGGIQQVWAIAVDSSCDIDHGWAEKVIA